MWEFLFDLLELLGLIGFKKRKKKEPELVTLETNDSTQKQDNSEEVTRQGVSICAGCHRTLKKGAIHESGKAWCMECYKIHVLKIKP